MYNNLKRFTDNVCYFHAQRSEGHSIDISEKDVPDGTELLIIIDSSTNSTESCKRISEKGIKIVVLDHHEQDEINDYCVLVNPQQSGCSYPNKHISGAVVAWKMCQVLDDYYNTNYSDDYYDVMAIGLQGDVMNMFTEYENRYIVHRGINNIKNIGITALLKEAKKNCDKINSTEIGFFISPSINAACRMDKIEVVLDLLVETNEKKASMLAIRVLELNEERKRIQAYFNHKLLPLVNEKDKCIIVVDDEIGKGFKGLVAGDFANKFQKPVMILTKENDIYVGSYRAYGNFDLKVFLNGIPQVLMAAGHAGAGGVRFRQEDLEVIQKYLNENLSIEAEDQFLEYMLEFELDEINEILIKNIETFYNINGKGFETGKFLITNVLPLSKEVMGKGRNTVKILCYPMDRTLFLDKDDIKKLIPVANLMKFRTNENYFDDSLLHKEIHVVGSLKFNEYYKRKDNQIFIEDFKVVV